MAKVALMSVYNYPSMPVRQLHAVLKKAGHQPVSVFFKRHRLDRMAPPTDAEYDIVHRTLKELDPAFMGISLRSTHAAVAAQVSDRFRAEGGVVVWGGTHATVAPETCVDHTDAICVGEGEGALVDIAQRLDEGNRDLTGIPNLWARGADGKMVETPQRPLIQDLDALPPAWFDDDECLYIENESVSDRLPTGFMTSYDLMTSRGCPYRCDFCCHSLLVDTYRGLGKYMRRRSPESVVQELEWAVGHYPTVNRIRFWDDVFPAVNRAWLEEFSVLYRERVGLPFWCYTYPNLSNPDILSLLQSAGLRYLGMGIQSGSARIRTEIFNRPNKTEDIIQAGQNFAKFDIHPEYDIICDNPFENEADFNETLDLLLGMKRPFSLFQHSLSYFPNFPLTLRALKDGHIQPEEVEHLSGKGYKQWHDEFSMNRRPEHIFWITLFYLTQFSLVPRSAIRALSQSSFFRAHPVLLNKLVKPVGRFAEKIRWARLYMKERGMALTLRRFVSKLLAIARTDTGGARAIWGAD